MLVTIHGAQLELVLGDISDQQVDAIVNAANSQLAGGGGVDGAIHRRGGPSIMQETRRLFPDGCPTGSAVITTAGSLAANYVIHAVGPIYSGAVSGEPDLLASAYRRCLELALEKQCRSIAFPSLSTGAYQYPLEQAAPLAIHTVVEFLHAHHRPQLVRFVLWNETALKAFSQAVALLET